MLIDALNIMYYNTKEKFLSYFFYEKYITKKLFNLLKPDRAIVKNK